MAQALQGQTVLPMTEHPTYDDMRKLLSDSEMSAMWHYHHDAELKCADRGEYDDAKWHKQRKSLFWREPNTPP